MIELQSERRSNQQTTRLCGSSWVFHAQRFPHVSTNHSIGFYKLSRSCQHQKVLERNSRPLARNFSNRLFDLSIAFRVDSVSELLDAVAF